MNKHSFSDLIGRLLFLYIMILFFSMPACRGQKSGINRYRLVTRHNIEHSAIDSLSPLSVGNGEFAFTVDITGLQTFPEFYERGIPLGTMSNWGWHTAPNPENFSLSDVYRTYNVHGREIDYVHQYRIPGDRKTEASEWLRNNPHRIHLGMIGLEMLTEHGEVVSIKELKNPVQKLNLWTGVIESFFLVEDEPVKVITVCHPDKDLISVMIVSDLVREKRLRVRINFPYGISAPAGYDFESPEKHKTTVIKDDDDITVFRREQDNDIYFVALTKRNSGLAEKGSHLFYLEPLKGRKLEFSVHFSKEMPGTESDDYRSVITASSKSWKRFWSEGAAVDFSDCTDPRAFELERRVILSRYLTKIQCSGSLPPAETGLTFNSWYGKFHLEMHWWHAVHFALWKNQDILEKQLEYYNRIFEMARQTARNQGYSGVRWPKMVGPDGRESPSTVGTYLIWQQPHPIFYAELLYRNADNKKQILDRYAKMVFATADFMSSYAWFDSTSNRYILGPVLIPAQESLRLETTINPPFELVYWYWALKTAAEWRSRMNLEPDEKWNDVITKISDLPVLDNLYLCSEDTRDSYENPRYMSDHPIVAAVNGVMPYTRLVDNRILSNTLDTILKKWDWQSAWGWDFPMLAISAASTGRYDLAIDFLMMDVPKNRYLVNGHNYQDARLPIYLPGNGGLLTAVAKMCRYDQFPENGKWKVKWENLNEYVE